MSESDYSYSDGEKMQKRKDKQDKRAKKKILGQNAKKVQRLMKRFQDESSDEDHEKYRIHKTQDKSKEIVQNDLKKSKKIKKNKEQLENQKKINEKAIEERQDGNEKTTLKNVFNDILKQSVKKQYKENPIFADYQRPLKQIKRELRKEKENKLRKKIKELKARRGHVKPSALAGDAQIKEKDLKIQTTKGIIKIFEAITAYQRDNE